MRIRESLSITSTGQHAQRDARTRNDYCDGARYQVCAMNRWDGIKWLR